MRCMDEGSRPLANSLRSVERVAGEELCQRCSGAPDSVEVRVTGKTVNFNKVNCWSPDMLKALQERHGGGAKHGV